MNGLHVHPVFSRASEKHRWPVHLRHRDDPRICAPSFLVHRLHCGGLVCHAQLIPKRDFITTSFAVSDPQATPPHMIFHGLALSNTIGANIPPLTLRDSRSNACVIAST